MKIAKAKARSSEQQGHAAGTPANLYIAKLGPKLGRSGLAWIPKGKRGRDSWGNSHELARGQWPLVKVLKNSDHVRNWEDYGDYTGRPFGFHYIINIFKILKPRSSNDLMIFAHGLASKGSK